MDKPLISSRRVAHFAGIINKRGAPFLAFFCEKWGLRLGAPSSASNDPCFSPSFAPVRRPQGANHSAARGPKSHFSNTTRSEAPRAFSLSTPRGPCDILTHRRRGPPALGRRTSVSNPYVSGSPVYTQFQYDALSRVIKVIPPDGTAASNNTQYSYSGNTATIIDPAGKQRRNYSDALGRLVRVDEPGGSPASGSVTITGTERYVCQSPLPQCDPIYDSGTVTVSVNGLAKTVIYFQNSTAASLASGLASKFNNDPNSPVSAGVSGATITFTSILSGNASNYSFLVTAQTNDPADFFDSSFNGSPASGTFTGGSDNGSPGSLAYPFATFYSYDATNNLIQVNQGAQQRAYVYGGLGHLLSAQTPESGLVTYSYQNAGAACSTDAQNVCQRTDARSITTTYQYDGLNRLKSVAYSDGTPSATYNYDAGGAGAYALGRLTSMTDGTGSETYTYNQLGRITAVAKVVGTATYNIAYGYNYVGQVKTLTYPDGIALNQSYDPAGRLAQISSGSTNYLTVPSTSYNAASLPRSLTYGSGVQATIGYDPRLQLASLDYAKGTTDLLNLTYNYTQTVNGNPVNNGQIQRVTDTRGDAYSTSYTYDALGRLAQGQTLNLTSANTWKLGWVYDRYGNRSQQNILGGTISTTAPQLTINPTTNRITTAGYSYDTAGNLQADGTGNAYTYDAENRLKTLNTGTTTATYSYDCKGLRVKKVVGANTTVYLFSGSKVIAEYTNGTLSVKYVYAGSQLLATLYQSTTTPVVYHYPDQLSARLETSPNGTVTRTFGHLPFGETWCETGVSVKQKFTSYERDTESGLDYAMMRYHSSRLGRFMTADLLAGSADDPQSLNRYAYVDNDPMNFIDPTGLGSIACFLDGFSIPCGSFSGLIFAGAIVNAPLGVGMGFPWMPVGSGSNYPSNCYVNVVTDQTWCPPDGGNSSGPANNTLPNGDVPIYGLMGHGADILAAAGKQATHDLGCAGMGWAVQGGSVAASGAVLSTGAKLGGATSGTSVASATARTIGLTVPSTPTPVGIPFTESFAWRSSSTLGGVLGRWFPYIGTAISSALFNHCVNQHP